MNKKRSKPRIKVVSENVEGDTIIRIFPAQYQDFYEASNKNALIANVFSTSTRWAIHVHNVPKAHNSYVWYYRKTKEEVLTIARWLVRSKRHAIRWGEIPTELS